MIDTLNICLPLAEKGNGNWIFGLVIVALWLISAAASQMNKKQEQERRRRLREQLEQGQSPQDKPSPPALSPPIERRKPIGPPQSRDAWNIASGLRRRLQEQIKQQANQRLQQMRPPPVQHPQPAKARSLPPKLPRAAAARVEPRQADFAAAAALPPNKQDISSSEIRSAGSAKAKGAGVTADSLHRWLRPETLRQQFILTEVLQRPVALRD